MTPTAAPEVTRTMYLCMYPIIQNSGSVFLLGPKLDSKIIYHNYKHHIKSIHFEIILSWCWKEKVVEVKETRTSRFQSLYDTFSS